MKYKESCFCDSKIQNYDVDTELTMVEIMTREWTVNHVNRFHVQHLKALTVC